MRNIHKPIIARVPISRVGELEPVVYSVNVNGATIYTGSTIVINREIVVRIDDILRQFAFRFGWNFDAETQQFRPSDLGEFLPVENHIFNVSVVSSGGSVSFDVTGEDCPVWRVADPTTNNTRITPHIPFVPTTNFFLFGLLKANCTDHSIRYKGIDKLAHEGEGANCATFAIDLFSLFAGEEYSDEGVRLTDPFGVDIATLAVVDACPTIRPYYIGWQTPEGGFCSLGFGGNKTTKTTTNKATITGVYDNEVITGATEATTYDVYSEPLNPDTYNEIGYGIATSPFVYLYDVEADNGCLCSVVANDWQTMPTRTSRMEAVHFELKTKNLKNW